MKLSFWTGILLFGAAAGAAVDWRASATLARETVAAHTRVAALRKTVDAAAASASAQQAAERVAEEKWDLIAAEMSVEQRYGPAPAKVWRRRIRALQEAMAKSDEPEIPELALLQLKDWIDAAVRADGASPEQLKKVLAALRATSRVRVAEKIHDALKQFLEHSGGVLPTDVQQLVPLLPSTLTAQMLAPYHLTKTGRPEKTDEHVIDGTFGIWTLSITPTGWASNAQANGDSATDAISVLSGLGGRGRNEEFSLWQGQMLRAIQQVGPMLEHMMPEPSMAALGPQVRAAVQQYMTAHGGQPPRTMADLQSLVPGITGLAEALRPVLANFEYAAEHEGSLATDPDRLTRYRAGLDDTQLLRRLRLTAKEDGHVDMDFDLSY
jgi:hypothetical protein